MKKMLQNEEQRDVCRLRKAYFSFAMMALIIFGACSCFFIVTEFGAVDMIIKTVLVAFIIYFLLGGCLVFHSSPYHRDYKLVILVLPLLMTFLGSVLGFWISYQEITVGLTEGPKALALLVALIAPLMALMSEKSLVIKPRGLMYLISLANLVLAGLIFYVAFRNISC